MQLLERGKKVVVIDRIDKNSATQVAAGLFNPITGKYMTKTWMADVLFPYLHDFYTQVERLTRATFFYPMPMYRPFISIEEQNGWMGKSTDPQMKGFVETVHATPIESHRVKNPLGGVRLKQCGYLDTQKFSQAVSEYIRKKGLLLEENFNEADLILKEGVAYYHEHCSSKIIFCQGEKALSNKMFSWLPIRPLKGELLTIETDEKISTIYNRGVYVVPDIWKVGATYSTTDTSQCATVEARAELIEKLNELVHFPYKIVSQSWGMRPTTPDRKPILGPHPIHPEVAIFNGLGTKGVSLAPYFSQVLTEWLENGVSLNNEVDIHRYKHYNYGGK
jgi:glycine/D-amino acid oxidase-like deaminating enzyme